VPSSASPGFGGHSGTLAQATVPYLGCLSDPGNTGLRSLASVAGGVDPLTMRFRPVKIVVVSAVAAAVSVVLILLPGAASGDRPASSTQPTQVTLTVSIVGSGTGEITSYPQPLNYPSGIDCPSICTAQFADGTVVDVHVQADPSSVTGGFSTAPPYFCPELYVPFRPPDTDDCTIEMDSQLASTASVQVTLNLKPVLCTVPGVKGTTLARARALITNGHCRVGEVTHIFSWKTKKGRVISQSPKPHAQRTKGAPVNLVVSKGAVAQTHASAGLQRVFFTPGLNAASCEIDVGLPALPTSVWCVEELKVPVNKAIGVTLTRKGHLKICRGEKCVGNPATNTPTLRYGRVLSLGPFRCTSLRAGVRCLVKATRQGFLLSAHRVERVG